MGEVADAVGEATAEEVEEHDTAAAGGEGVGDGAKGHAGGGDAVDENDLGASSGAPFVDADGAVLWGCVSARTSYYGLHRRLPREEDCRERNSPVSRRPGPPGKSPDGSAVS